MELKKLILIWTAENYLWSTVTGGFYNSGMSKGQILYLNGFWVVLL